MPTIVFAAPKGGAGKTTSALILATQLAKLAPVIVIDADIKCPLMDWSRGPNLPSNLTVIAALDEDTIDDVIDVAAAKATFVIVDLEGTAKKIVAMAISRADFVVIPTQGSAMDAKAASSALTLVRQHEKIAQRYKDGYKLPHAILFTVTDAMIQTRTTTRLKKDLAGAGIPMFKSEINRREAFKAIFEFQQPLEFLDALHVSGVAKAIENAQTFTSEMIEFLKENK